MIHLDNCVVAGVLLPELPGQLRFDLLVRQLDFIGNHHVENEVGVQGTGGDAKVVNGEGRVDFRSRSTSGFPI